MLTRVFRWLWEDGLLEGPEDSRLLGLSMWVRTAAAPAGDSGHDKRGRQILGMFWSNPADFVDELSGGQRGEQKSKIIPHFLAARLSTSSAVHWGGEDRHGMGGSRYGRDEGLRFCHGGLDEHIKSSLQLHEVGTIVNPTLNRMLLTECLCPLKSHTGT